MGKAARLEAVETSGADARVHPRVRGPFDGLRIGVIDTPVSVYDLSEGGCFVTCPLPQPTGAEIDLKIELPGEGWIAAKGRAIREFAEFGFALEFIDMEADDRARLGRVLDRLPKAQACPR